MNLNFFINNLGSDGANSFIRNKVNFNVMKWDYDQVAIVATLKLTEVFQKLFIRNLINSPITTILI